MTIITGWGKHSEGPSVLRNETRKDIENSFDPPLTIVEVPDNAGRLIVPERAIARWVAAQQANFGKPPLREGAAWRSPVVSR